MTEIKISIRVLHDVILHENIVSQSLKAMMHSCTPRYVGAERHAAEDKDDEADDWGRNEHSSVEAQPREVNCDLLAEVAPEYENVKKYQQLKMVKRFAVKLS